MIHLQVDRQIENGHVHQSTLWNSITDAVHPSACIPIPEVFLVLYNLHLVQRDRPVLLMDDKKKYKKRNEIFTLYLLKKREYFVEFLEINIPRILKFYYFGVN